MVWDDLHIFRVGCLAGNHQCVTESHIVKRFGIDDIDAVQFLLKGVDIHAVGPVLYM